MDFCVCVYVSEGEQREKTLSHHTIQQLILEKDQALADLNSVEKSLADLFRRYEKMKDVLEGFRKVSHFALRLLKVKVIVSFYLQFCIVMYFRAKQNI